MEKDNLKRARKFAKLIYKREGLKVPVDIKKILKDYANVEGADIPFQGDAICVNKEYDKPLIIYNSNMIDTRIRFTLAHELGHIMIPWHTGMISCNTDNIDDINPGKYKDIETEANVFASEILMPTDWLKNKVNQYISKGFEFTINKIAEEANTSFLASLYAVINVLPQGCVVSIYNEYSHRRIIGEEYKVFWIYHEYDISNEWLEINTIQEEFIERENELIVFRDFGKSVEEDYIENNSDIDLREFFNDVFSIQMKNPIMIIPYILKKLPPGYVIKVKVLRDESSRIEMSKDTHIRISEPEYDKNCIDKGTYINQTYEINWWKFNILNKIETDCIDSRDSKSILKEIIERNYPIDERISPRSKVNGVIGALNNTRKRENYTKDKFYSILHQKFLGNEDIKPIIEDPDFDKFLVTKTMELYS